MNRCGAVFGKVIRWVRWAIWAGLPLACFAQTNSWNSPASGHWEDSTWSLGIPPAADQSVMITNAGSKAVGVFSTTAANFPGTMTVDNLAISAPSNSRNTLLLNYVGTAVPLQVLNYCAIGNNGSILNLSSSLRMGGSFSITTNGSFIQQGGMTVVTNWWVAQIEGGTAAVTNGVFLFTQMEIGDGGGFTQSGGSVSGNLEIENDGTYNLIDGSLFFGALSIDGFSTNAGIFNQSGGTNIVSYLSSSGAYHLSGGLLSTSNAFVFSGDVGFEQSGGVHLAGGTLSCEDYTLTGGTLVASNLQVFGTLAIGPSPASISNTTLFALQGNGTLQLSNCTLHLAPLVSFGKGVIQFFGNDKLTFADSSTQSWSGSLTVSNWNGSTLGGGVDQLIFGNGKSGLTLRQLERIAFVDPAGFSPGTWRATILPTGEVIPTTSPTGPTQPNLWTSSASGHWEDLTWSLGVPPASNQTVLITNAGLKAVGISPSTPVNFPATMTVGDLVVSAPNGGSNTLLLNFSGTNVPLQMINDCTVGTNGNLENLHSGLEVGGDLIVSNGTFVQVGGVTGITNSLLVAGSVEVTNPALLLVSGPCSVLTNASFVQEGGLMVCSNSFLGIDGGLVNISNATMVLGGIDVNNGSFGQTGGSLNAREVDVRAGNFYFGGGTASIQSIGASGPTPFSVATFSLDGGTITSTNVSIFNGGIFQSNGRLIVNGGVELRGLFIDYGPPYFGGYFISGGSLSCQSFSVFDVGSVFQSGGTNDVAGDLGFGRIVTYSLSGGMLCTSNTSLAQENEIDTGLDTHFVQSGGVHWVTNSLSLAGFYADYTLGAGILVASNIVLADQSRLIVGESPGVTISNGGSFTLQAGTLELSNTVQNLGALIMSPGVSFFFPYSHNHIGFASGSGRVRFADSSRQKWDSAGILYIDGWNGSAAGGGADQIVFGNSASGLTPAQLQQIQFESPAGFPPGTWFAKILPTGEIVPTLQPTLMASVSGTNLLVQWPVSSGLVLQAATNAAGPFEDISNALDPFTNDTTLFPQRFFRLRKPQ